MLQRLLGILAPISCVECGLEGKALCHVCSALVAAPVSTPRFEMVEQYIAASLYVGSTVKLIHQLKYGRNRSVAASLATLMIVRAQGLLEMACIVTFIPSSPSHYRSRGYNQAEALAKEISRQSALPCRALLWRVGKAQQMGHSRSVRQWQAARAFAPRYPRSIRGATVLIVDDVVTTGATVSAAARCLRSAGARRIFVLSAAYQPYSKS